MADEKKLNFIQKGLLQLFGLKPEDLPGHQRGEAEMSWIEFLRSGLDPFTGYAQISQDRIVRYNDYDLMDSYSDIATALDIYGEEASQPDPRKKRAVWIESENKEIKQAGKEFLSALRIEDRVYALARNCAKYGDLFEYILTNHTGIYNMQFIHPSRVNRIESDKLLGFQCDELARLMMRTGAAPSPEGRFFTPWDFVHFRMEAFDRETIYGRSMIEHVRKTWKELQILETMVAVFRVTKSVQRNIFVIDVSDASPQESREILEKWRTHLRKQQFIDPQTGDFRIDAPAVTPLEDLILPIRGKDNQTRVEKLQADPDIGAVEDLHYFRTKLRTALGIPKQYFDQELDGTGWNAKEGLVMQDQRFSRKITKVQKSVKSGLSREFAIHLTLKGIKWEPGDFTVEMAPVNQIIERLKEEWWLRRAELLNVLLPVAQIAGFDPLEWNKIICGELLPLSPTRMKKLLTPPTMVVGPDGQPVGAAGPAGPGGGGAGGGTSTSAAVPGQFPTFMGPDEASPSMLSDLFGDNPDVREKVRTIIELYENKISGMFDIAEQLEEAIEEKRQEKQELTEQLYDVRHDLNEAVAEMKGRKPLKLNEVLTEESIGLVYGDEQLATNDRIQRRNEGRTQRRGTNKPPEGVDVTALDRKKG